MWSTISMKYKQLYHILDYGQHLSCGGRNGCGICYKKRRKKFKHALFTQIAIQLNFLGLINTFPIWCIVNHEMDPLAYLILQLDGGEAHCPGEALCPMLLYTSILLYKTHCSSSTNIFRKLLLFLLIIILTSNHFRFILQYKMRCYIQNT